MFNHQRKESFPEREERVLNFWQTEHVFQKQLQGTEGKPLFSFYDGPPFATGLPHYGHLLAGTIKDVVPRYKSMQGYYVPRRFGWDCHGLPVENEIEKSKALSGVGSIEQFGIGAFNEECRKIVLRYTEQWKTTVNRMGRWVDFDHTYRTMDLSFMESVWHVFSEMYEKGLVYEGFKVMPFSAKLGTPLSNFEANLNYKEVDDPSLTVLFPLVDEPDTVLLAWTTTPWTLPSNLALAVRGDFDYVKIEVKETGKKLILAKERLKAHFKEEDAYQVLETFKGEKLKDQRYVPLFDYFKGDESRFRVLVDEFVGADDGTGIVHLAPAFGESDFFVCQREGIDVVCPIDQNGMFTKEIPEYQGLFVKDADKQIIRSLKEKERVFHHGQIRHRYPFCWRSDTPLIYKAVRTWFIAVEKIKDRLVAANQQITWVPENIKDGRFGKWLENARDWAISRNRYWGTPIPLWRTAAGKIKVISSVEELEKLTGQKVTDLHRHYIDDLSFVIDGEEYHRIPEVFDCWFESGSMPYAQNHFPFENKQETLDAFPADFIAEGLDQTRGWFYTLTVIAVALFDKPAFKNVIVNGILLAEDGTKMSKSLKNYPEPELVINKYGADAVRLYLLHSPAVRADDLRFSERGVELVLRQFLIPFWNSYVFFATYASIYNWQPESKLKEKPAADIDRWILSRLQKLTHDVTHAMDHYDLSNAVEPFVAFIDELTNWYIRRNRSRFWADEASRDRDEAFEVLYHVLKELTVIAAPFIPFLSDAIYQELRSENDPLSVHLCSFPKVDGNWRDEELEEQMGFVKDVVSTAHALRKEHKMKVRQPLAKASLISSDERVLNLLRQQEQLILDELNVKEIEYLADESSFVSVNTKANFRTLGRKAGKMMPQLKAAIENLQNAQLEKLQAQEIVMLDLENEKFELVADDVLIERKVKEGIAAQTIGEVTCALDLELNNDLLLEGLAREIVNKLNTMRRDQGLEVTDRIIVHMMTTERVKECFAIYREYIMHEVLAKDVHFEQCTGTEWDLNGEIATITIEKA